MSRRSRIALGLLLLAATAGHVVFWYGGRERAAVSGSLAAELAAPDVVAGVWLPFPHQNLRRLERRTGDLRRWIARLGPAGRSGEAIPGFGPFVVPPSRELVVVTTADGGVRAAARLLPTVAVLARWAGRLAGNPWLAGGPVGEGEEVRWEGRLWRYRRGPAGAPPAVALRLPESPVLGLVRLVRPAGPLPAGLYRLARVPREAGAPARLELRAGDPPAIGPLAPEGPFWLRRELPDAWWVERTAGEGRRGVLVEAGGADRLGLPRIAVFARGGAEFDLPGEELVELVGGEVPERFEADLRIRSLERTALAPAARFAAAAEALLAAGLDRAAGADPDRMAPAAAGIARALRQVPVFGAAEARPFERLAALLEPLRGCGRASLAVGPGGAWVRLVPCHGRPAGGAAAIDPTR